MPIYIVRWPTFSVSLVRARNEDELIDKLDEVDDPGACRWALYQGPLWIDLDLPVRINEPGNHKAPLSLDDIRVDGVERVLEDEEPAYDVSIGGADTGSDMQSAITKGCGSIRTEPIRLKSCGFG